VTFRVAIWVWILPLRLISLTPDLFNRTNQIQELIEQIEPDKKVW